MDKKLKEDLKAGFDQLVLIVSKLAAGQPVSKADCDTMLALQAKLDASLLAAPVQSQN